VPLPPIVNLADVRDLIDPSPDPAGPDQVVLCDVRWYLDGRDGETAYRSGHIPGAIFIDLDHDLSDHSLAPERGRHPLPDGSGFAARLGMLGISPGNPVVAYDDSGGTVAGRFVWMLRAIGHDAALLDGGLKAWPGQLESDPNSRPAVPYPEAQWSDDLVVTADDVPAAIAAGGHVFDVRSPNRYRGESEPADARAGHVPGAVNLYLGGNTDEAGQFLPTSDLAERFTDAGVSGQGSVIVYCGSGVSACQTLLAIEHVGLGRQRLFPGSWSEWSNDPSRPLATGETP
jgi:thiosulfate/3-mercaptopyruvate sulfurtransferase